jgi:hypothetical protein
MLKIIISFLKSFEGFSKYCSFLLLLNNKNILIIVILHMRYLIVPLPVCPERQRKIPIKVQNLPRFNPVFLVVY